MSLRPIPYILFLLFFSISSFGQINENRKTLASTRVSTAPKIDGILTDAAWKNAPIATDFIIHKPNNGAPAPSTHKTVVKIIYDDSAIYVSALLYDNNPASIPVEFGNRDNLESNSDFFFIRFNPNDDGKNAYAFSVTSAGTQIDAKISNGDGDFNWSAVWERSVQITEEGWSLEMKIPYSALRFSNQKTQSWGINMHRKIQTLDTELTWNFIDNTQGTWTQYDGVLENLTSINPPTRLSFYPYASVTTQQYDGETSWSASAGMDLKYGVTENFTLDATLIPDFSQTAFDDVTLNLGPFEQQFSEQRQFFTEGTELFSKGRLFYSRRIGASPSAYGAPYEGLAANEEIIENPEKVSMLNALKVSGRTKGGLGIGFFNAVTNKTQATIKNTVTNEIRNVVTEPFANYNVMVLDKQIKKNSSISFINTNVLRDGHFRDANVTGLLYHLSNKKGSYFIDGGIKSSTINTDNVFSTGYSFDTSIAKNAGNWQGEIGYNFEDSKFDINDLGYQDRNNKQRIYGNLSYRILKPSKKFNAYQINSWYNVSYLHNSGIYTGNNVGLNVFFMTKSRLAFGGNLGGNIGKQYDYYEAREDISSGIYYLSPARATIRQWGSTDYRKKFALDYGFFYSAFKDDAKEGVGFKISPRYRFNNRFALNYEFRQRKITAEKGYLTKTDAEDIIFGQRNRKAIENSIGAKYSFSNKSGLSLSFRHYWETVQYATQHYALESDGTLSANSYSGTEDVNYNSWNLDLNYNWEFAPGSQLIAFYRNTINPSSTFAPATLNFNENIQALFDEKMKHVFSLRFIYFIDYNNLKKIFS